MIFLESPWPILFLGIVAEAILLLVLFRTGRGVLLWAIGGVALVVLLGVVIERHVVTDKKLVAQTLDEVCAGLEAGDLNRVLAQISKDPRAAPTREAVRDVLAGFEVIRLSIRGLDFDNVNRTTSPPTASVTFMVIATGRSRHVDMMGEGTRPGQLRVRLQRESGRWLILEHKILQDPRNG